MMEVTYIQIIGWKFLRESDDLGKKIGLTSATDYVTHPFLKNKWERWKLRRALRKIAHEQIENIIWKSTWNHS